jgi:hypothetical protein
MAQSQRTFAQLEALLADNASADVSAQDVRDMLESLRSGHGSIYVTTPAATVITDTVSWFPLLGTYTLVPSPAAYNWSHPSNGVLRYTGAQSRLVVVTFNCSLISVSNNQLLHVHIAKNGVELPESHMERKQPQGADQGFVSGHAITSAVNGDDFDVRVQNSTSADNVTADHLALHAQDSIA